MTKITQEILFDLESSILSELEKFKSLDNIDESKVIFSKLEKITEPYIEFFLGWSERHKRDREQVKITDFLSTFFSEIDRIDLDSQRRLIFDKYKK